MGAKSFIFYSWKMAAEPFSLYCNLDNDSGPISRNSGAAGSGKVS
jgi:hypothetical protein